MKLAKACHLIRAVDGLSYFSFTTTAASGACLTFELPFSFAERIFLVVGNM
jgi:hypothetical protein